MNNLNKKKEILPVFIGGTGRSGTTIFSKILGQSNTVYSFPEELRFITDPDGILPLNHALVNDWSKFQADLAFERFLKLLFNLKFRYKGRYPNHAHSEIVGLNFYNDWINKIQNELVSYTMKSGWAARVNVYQKVMLKFFGRNQVTNSLIKPAYYCPPLSQIEFNKIFNQFILDFFNQTAALNKANVIIDHTPSNLIHFDRINQIVPNAKLIHIFRDPRDVVCSYKTKDWGNTSVLENVIWVKDVYSRWNDLKQDLDSKTFLEVKFESLIENSKGELTRICDFLDIPFEDSFLDLDVSKHNIGRWKKDLEKQEIDIVHKYLNKHIYNLGY